MSRAPVVLRLRVDTGGFIGDERALAQRIREAVAKAQRAPSEAELLSYVDETADARRHL